MKNFWQIYVDRRDGKGPSLDGCWGSEHASFDMDDLDAANAALEHLAKLYPDADWVLMQVHSKIEQRRIRSTTGFTWFKKTDQDTITEFSAA